ncbi:MAG: alanine racemase, partial [Proteobacteria bacterium]|nr:alanine racemase [Pseudomonadota bacterium]
MIESQSKQWRRASVSIDPGALSHNLNLVREYAPNCQVMAVIKSNAYGHGMLEVAEHLSGADIFAVAMPQEAFALREAG